MEIWNKYEKCKNYLDQTGLVSRVNEQWDFYLDNQWNVGRNTSLSTGNPLPYFNIIKSIIKFQLSTIASNRMIPTFNYMGDDADKDTLRGKIEVAKLINKQQRNDWKKAKQKQKSWNIIKQGLIEGGAYQYCGTADPKDDQIIMSTNIMFGDESNNSIQEQPYIIIRERLLVEDVKRVATKYLPADEVRTIEADTDDQYLINKELKRDVEGKITSILYMEKRDGVVWWGKTIDGLEYVPMKALKSSVNGEEIFCKLYPVAAYLPEEQPNSARGLSFVRPMIPNQIEINKTLARRAESNKIASFPRPIYNVNAVTNPDDLDKVGAKIGLDGSTDDIRAAIGFLNPVSSSSDASALQTELISLTRELNGSIDALTGATDPTRVSGQAVYAMVAQSEKPLNEPVDRFSQFIEDLTAIYLEQKRVYYPSGFMVDGILLNGEALRDIELEVSIDVSQDTPWTRAAEKSFVDNLLEKQLITLPQYVDLAPDQSEVPKAKLKKMFNEMKEQQPQGVPNETPM